MNAVELREAIKTELLKQRKLTDSTLRTYTSLLFSIIKKGDFPFSLESFNKEENMLEYINKNQVAQSRKTMLSAIFVLTKNEVYGKEMSSQIKLVNEDYKKMIMTPERKEKLLTPDGIKKINDELIAIYKKKKNGDSLNDALISMLHSGVYLPPRRLEFASVKTRDYNKLTDNYIIKNRIYLNKYKTAAKYGMQQLILPKEIMIYVNKALRENESGFLIESQSGAPYSSSTLSKKLKSMFGIGIDLLRSSYINHTLYEDGLYKKMQETAEAMGNSVESQQDYYVKNNV